MEEALASTGEGLDWCMSQGVAPRFTVWCPEPLAQLGPADGPAPLEYHVGLLRHWRDTHKKHGLPVPPGYGAPAECAERLHAFEAAGVHTMIIRFPSYDQKGQLARFLSEVAPQL